MKMEDWVKAKHVEVTPAVRRGSLSITQSPGALGPLFRHTRDLLSLLFTVAPEVAYDAHLLERSVLLTGVKPHTTAADLLDLFPLKTDAAVVVRDYETGDRAGLVVLANVGACDKAIRNDFQPVEGFSAPGIFYRSCIRATARQYAWVYAAAARDHVRRRGTTDLLRRLLPPAYIDEDSSIHTRCVFARGAYSVSSLDDALPAKGSVCAVIACKAQSVAVMVYDDEGSAEEVARILVKSRRLMIYDSPMFPFRSVSNTAGAAAGDQLGLGGMIPSSLTQAEYLERIVLFRGVDTEHCDARDVARCIMNGLEALIIHRGQGLVFAVFSTREEARLQLQETEETWISLFGRPVACKLVDEDEEELPTPAGRPYPGVDPEAIDALMHAIDGKMKQLAPDDAEGIAKLLIMSAVFSRPDALRHRAFPERAVLLLGIGVHPATATNWDDLSEALTITYGGLDDLRPCPGGSAALAVFKKRSAALKLLQEPLGSCCRIGFRNCQRVPGADRAAETADSVCAVLFALDAQIKLFESQV
ncbi:unnamed protein product [Alopecurus aequalis]